MGVLRTVFVFVVATLCCFSVVFGQIRLDAHFDSCRLNSSNFDSCMKDALNALTPYFKSGLPDYGIAPFDPFFAKEVPQKMGGPFFNYKLILRNVTESGWTSAQITRFKSDLNKNYIQFVHFFPDKRLSGHYEISGNFFGTKINNKGAWNLALFDYIQTMTISRKPRQDISGRKIYDTPLKVSVQLQSCKNLELHIDHLLGGRTLAEGMLDRIINTVWQPGFILLRPIINDLVGTAFTEIMNKNFRYFPFDQIFKD